MKTLPARQFSSMFIGDGDVRHFSIDNVDALHELRQYFLNGEPIHISGDGTNTVYGHYSGIVATVDLKGVVWLDDVTLKVMGGEPWQSCVDASLDRGVCGIERLTQIPGKTGAAPVQNIGAFGQLLSDRLKEVEVYDLATDKFLTIPGSECGFGDHRSSYFKTNPDWQHYIITAIILELLDVNQFEAPNGEGIVLFAQERKLEAHDVRGAEHLIAEFRKTLYPNYQLTPNCGSYFTNYEVSTEEAKRLPRSIWEVKHRETRDGKSVMFQCKDLLRSVGIDAGYEFSGGLKMHNQFNNFLINPERRATPQDLLQCHQTVNNLLYEKYGVTLIPEPEFVQD